MRPAATLSAFAAALVVVFGAAAGVGAAVGPVGTVDAADPMAQHSAGAGDAGRAEDGTHSEDGTGAGNGTAAGDEAHSEDEAHAGDGAHGDPTDVTATGLGIAQDGYVLRLEQSVLGAGVRTPFRFVVQDEDGEPVTAYETSHDKELHLVVARRDLTGFQHVHPEREADGTWSVPLLLPEAGPYKVFADFVPQDGDSAVVLAADVTVPGTYAPGPAATPAAVATVDDYQVELEGELVAGTRSELTLTVTRDGRPVEDLQPYLGAFGHLVALRDGDLAYLHVHAEESTDAGPALAFAVDVPTAATYRLFLDFQHGDVVRNAALTAVATTGEADR